MVTPIERDELQRLIGTGGIVVVDALPRSYYDEMHLPGAINLVEADVDEHVGRLLPDKVTYCSNAACGNSSAVARRLEASGYTNVRTYGEGIQDWVENGNPTDTVVPA